MRGLEEPMAVAIGDDAQMEMAEERVLQLSKL